MVSGSVKGPKPIPAAAGIGLRGPHHRQFLAEKPHVSWLEVHSENFFAEHSIACGALERIREDYPLSLHGVGLSMGSVDPLQTEHLHRLRCLADRLEPGLISEHLSWGSIDGSFLNDLLPLPYTQEALDHMVRRVGQVQALLGRQILIENVSSYLDFAISAMPEWEFLSALARRSGCGILLDINNIYVNAINHGFDPNDYINYIAPQFVHEMHLAGHSVQVFQGREILIDTHDTPVCEEVWVLFEAAVRRFGTRPTLIEWDSDLPPLQTLLAEAERAQAILDEAHDLAA